jgi:hypothetical protein
LFILSTNCYKSFHLVFFVFNLPFSSEHIDGQFLAICWWVPTNKFNVDLGSYLTPNWRHVSSKIGYRNGSLEWSTVGTRWWRVWFPKVVATSKKWLLFPRTSRVASTCKYVVWNEWFADSNNEACFLQLVF